MVDKEIDSQRDTKRVITMRSVKLGGHATRELFLKGKAYYNSPPC